MGCRKAVILTCDYEGDFCDGPRTIEVPTIQEAKVIAHGDELWIFHQVAGKKVAWCGKCHADYRRTNNRMVRG